MALNAPHIEFYVSNGPTYDTTNFTATFTLKCRGKAVDSASAVKWYLDGILYGSSLYRSGPLSNTDPVTVLGINTYIMADLKNKRYSATLNTSTFTDFNWSQSYTIYYDTLTGNPIPNQYYSVIWAKPYNLNGDVPIHTGHQLGVDEGYINLQYISEVTLSDEYDFSWHQYFYNDTDGNTRVDSSLHYGEGGFIKFKELDENETNINKIMRCLTSGVRTLEAGGGGYVALDSISSATHPYSLWVPGEIEEGNFSNIEFMPYGNLKVSNLTEYSNLTNFSLNQQNISISANEFIEY